MIKFWKEYIEADMLERPDKLENITNRFMDLVDSKMETDLKKQVVNMLLQSYFDDLIEVCDDIHDDLESEEE